MKFILLPFVLTFLSLSGCSYGPPIKLGSSVYPVSEQLTKSETITANTLALTYAPKSFYIQAKPNNICNYFYTDDFDCLQQAKRQRGQPNLTASVKLVRSKVEFDSYDAEKNVFSAVYKLSKVIDIYKGDTQYFVTITGISNGHKVSFSPKSIKKYIDFDRELLHKIPFDTSGYYISGYASIPIPKEFRLSSDSKLDRLLIPVHWGKKTKFQKSWKKSDYDNDEQLAFFNSSLSGKKPKYKKIVQFRNIGDNLDDPRYPKMFVLARGIPEYFNWAKLNSPSEFLAKKKRLGGQYSRQLRAKQLAEKRAAIKLQKFNDKIKIIHSALQESGYNNDFKQFADVAESCQLLRSIRNEVNSFDCEDAINTSYTSLISQCENKQNRVLRRFKPDIDYTCDSSSSYEKQFNQFFGGRNAKAVKAVLEEYQDKNYVDYKSITRSFRYARVDTDKWERYWKRESDNKRDAIRDARYAEQQAQSQRFWKDAMQKLNEPSHLDKLFKQPNADILGFDNQRQTNQQGNTSVSTTTTTVNGSAVHLTNAATQAHGKQNKTQILSSKYQKQLLYIDNPRHKNKKSCSPPGFMTPTFNSSGKEREGLKALGKARKYMIDQCNGESRIFSGLQDSKLIVGNSCTVIDSKQHKHFKNTTVRTYSCAVDPIKFSCKCNSDQYKAGKGITR